MSGSGFIFWLSSRKIFRLTVAWLTTFCFVLNTAGLSFSQVVVDPNAQNKPSVSQSQNGTQVINITGPNQSGVSHNKFTDYNVGVDGIIINNSLTSGQSQIGGQVGGNSNLNGAPAKLILNEVTGGNISNILGQTEIFGGAADFILANPNGITCRGCGFINTPRATLTTGKPQIDPNTGDLLGFDVSGGRIEIFQRDVNGEQIGVDARQVDFFDIISRSVFLDGKILGNKEVGLFAGLNSFDYKSRKITASKAGDGSLELGIDSTLLGGAYANKLTMVSTEKGVGIRAPRDMKAAQGGISLTADGKIIFGKASSKGRIKAVSRSGGIQVDEKIWSETALELTAEGNVDLLENAFASSKGKVTIKTSSAIEVAKGGFVGSGFEEDGTSLSEGVLTIEAANLNNQGSLQAGVEIQIELTGDGISTNGGEIISGQTLALISGSFFVNQTGGLLVGDKIVSLDIAQFINEGSLSSDGDIKINSDDVVNWGKIASGNNTDITVKNDFANAEGGEVTAGGDLNITAGNDIKNVKGTLAAQGDVKLKAENEVANLSGTLSGENVRIEATTFQNITLVARSGNLRDDYDISDLTKVTEAMASEVLNSLNALKGSRSQENAVLFDQVSQALVDQVIALLASDFKVVFADPNAAATNGTSASQAPQQQGIDATLLKTQLLGHVKQLLQGELISGDQQSYYSQLSSSLMARASSLAGIVSDVDTSSALTKLSETAKASFGASYSTLADSDNSALEAIAKSASEKAKDLLSEKYQRLYANNSSALLDVSTKLLNDLTKQGTTARAPPLDQSTVTTLATNLVSEKYVTPFKLNARFTSLLKNSNTTRSSSGNYTDTLQGIAQINATNDILIQTTQNLTSSGGKFDAGQDITLIAGSNLNLLSQYTESYRYSGSSKNNNTRYELNHTLTELNAGGNINLGAEQDANFKGITIAAKGNVRASAKGRVVVAGVQNRLQTSSYRVKKKWYGKKTVYASALAQGTTIPGTIVADGHIFLESLNEDVIVRAAEMASDEFLFFRSFTGNVITEAQLDYRYSSNRKKSSWGILGITLSSKDKRNWDNVEENKVTFVHSKGDVIFDSGEGDISINGTVVSSLSDIYLTGQNIDFNAVINRIESRELIEEFGFFASFSSGGSGFSATIGFKDEKSDTRDEQRIAVASTLTARNIYINAKKDFTSHGAEVFAEQNIEVKAGGDVNILPSYNETLHTEKHRLKQIGITVSVQEHVTSSLDSLKSSGRALGLLGGESELSGKGSTSNKIISGISSTLRAVEAINTLMTGSLASAGVSFGVSGSKSDLYQHSITAKGSVFASTEGLQVVAGNNINVTGSQIESASVFMDAGNDLNIKSAQDVFTEIASNSSFSASAGINVGVGFTGVTVGASFGANFQKGNSKSKGVTHVHSVIAGNNVKLKSGNDTTIEGGVVQGNDVDVQVGGDLRVASVQDTYRLDAKSIGAGISLSFGLASSQTLVTDPNAVGNPFAKPTIFNGYNKTFNNNFLSDTAALPGKAIGAFNDGSASQSLGFNFNYGKDHADVAWVNQQSGIFSSDRVNVEVGNNTHLKGGVIYSETNNLAFSTETITFEDIQDRDIRETYNIGLSLSLDLNSKELVPQRLSNGQITLAQQDKGITIGGWGIEGGYEKKDKRQVTRATIGEGQLEVRDQEAQKKLVSLGKTKGIEELNRDIGKAQEITKDEHDRVGVYVTKSSIDAAIKAGKTIVDIFGDVLDRINEPAFAKEVRSLKDKSPEERKAIIKGYLKQLADNPACGGGQQAFNWNPMHLFITPAYAAGCTLKTITGETIVIHDTYSCFWAFGLIIANTLDAATSKKFYVGIGKGALKKGQEYAEAFANIDIFSLLSALENIDFNNLDEKALGLAKGVVGGLEKQLYTTLQAIANEDYEKAGELLSGLAIDVVIKIVAPAAGGAIAVAKGSKALTKLLAVARRAGCSFTPDTPVLMADGTLKPIGEITVGDMVASRNEFTFVYSKRPVTAVMVHDDPVKVHLTVETSEQKLETIETTPEHPFYIAGKGFLRADALKPDMFVSRFAPNQPILHLTSHRADHTGFLRVKAVTLEKRTFKAWNLTVGKDHTFYVGQSKLWVHNDCFDKLPGGYSSTGKRNKYGQETFVDANGKELYKGHDGRFYNPSVHKPISLGEAILKDAQKVMADGVSMTSRQKRALKENMRVAQRRSPKATEAMRADFDKNQARYISDWEKQTGQVWPPGATPHHIVPITSGGANKWYNLMPTYGRLPNHSHPNIGRPGPHASDGLLRSTIQGNNFKPGQTRTLW